MRDMRNGFLSEDLRSFFDLPRVNNSNTVCGVQYTYRQQYFPIFGEFRRAGLLGEVDYERAHAKKSNKE